MLNLFAILPLVIAGFSAFADNHAAESKPPRHHLPSDAQVRTTRSGVMGGGVRFYRDTTHSQLGEAWRDPSGMIWGDMVKNEEGSPRFMTWKDAAAYCRSIDAALPSREDFTRLNYYLTDPIDPQVNFGYTPQILPNLYTGNANRYFWSSSTLESVFEPKRAYVFCGADGHLISSDRTIALDNAVRCVVARGTPAK